MKPNANLYRLNAIMDFAKAQQAFLRQIDFFNPEPQVVKTLDLFPQLDKSHLSRLITWKGVDKKSRVTDRLLDFQKYPFQSLLKDLIQELNERNFQKHLRHPDMDLSPLINFKIVEVKWFLKLWEDKNRYVPHYAPKRLKNGIKFVLSGNELTASFQHVSKSLWYETDYNPTTVIPLTHENFDRVIQQQAELAKTYLQEKEKK